MSDNPIYIGTVVNITINVVGIAVSDIAAMEVSMEKHGQAAIVFTSAAGDVTIGVSSINVRIGSGIITNPGVYRLRIKATKNGDPLGLTPAPSTITVI